MLRDIMVPRLFHIFLSFGLVLFAGACLSPAAFGQPVKIIFETDMETDCDDAAALAILHYYADRDEIELLGVMSNSPSPDSVAAIDAINTYYGRPDLPIGAYKGRQVGREFTPIYREINQHTDLYPHDIVHRNQVPSATSLYTNLLAQHDDVVIVSVGYLQNISHLLRSDGGATLVAEKVAHMIVVGGSVGRLNGEHNLTVAGSAKSARFVLETFPRPMLFTPAEVGSTILTGAKLTDNDTRNPVRAAYDVFSRVATNRHFPNGPFSPHVDMGPPLQDGRPSWDQIGVLLGIFGPTPFFQVISEGYMSVERGERGDTEWRVDEHYPNHQNHAYVTKLSSDETIANAITLAMDYDPAGDPANQD